MAGKIHRRKKSSDFVVLDTHCMQSKTLKWAAKGLHTYLMQLPEDWQINISDLENRSEDGRDATITAMNALIKAGYVVRDRIHNEKGHFEGYDYHVYERPEYAISGLTVNGKSVNGLSVNGKTATSKYYTPTELNKNEESAPPAPVEIPTVKAEEVKRGLVSPPPAESAAATALTYDQYPNPRNSQQLKEAMRNYFVANPREWQDGVLEQSRATNWPPEKIQDCITAFCAHQEGEGNLKRTYGQYKGMMVKWFLAQPGFDKAKPGASASSQQQAPSNIPSALQGLIGK